MNKNIIVIGVLLLVGLVKVCSESQPPARGLFLVSLHTRFAILMQMTHGNSESIHIENSQIDKG